MLYDKDDDVGLIDLAPDKLLRNPSQPPTDWNDPSLYHSAAGTPFSLGYPPDSTSPASSFGTGASNAGSLLSDNASPFTSYEHQVANWPAALAIHTLDAAKLA